MALKKKIDQVAAGIVGFGLSGKVFHAPFLNAHPGFMLKTIMTSGDEAGKLYPDVKIARQFDDLLKDPGIDLIVICSPNGFHFDQAIKALEAGKDVILEKPLTPTVGEARELFRIAEDCGKHVFPFQNRRWDGDFLTIRHILEEGYLGEVLEFETHFDRYNPEVGRASWRYSGTPAGGTLYDLGIHLIDQAIVLFGAPEAVFCRLFNQRENSAADDSFDLKLIYPGVNVTVKAGVFVREPGPRFSLHGRAGSFVKYGLDPQEAMLRKGKAPGGAGWGTEARKNWGLLHTEFKGKKIRVRYETMPGNYMAFFDNVFDVLANGNEPAVKPLEVMATLRIIEQAIESDRKKSIIKFEL
jgi:scyllo-inositol 2-dehydrogenase (NADP+)